MKKSATLILFSLLTVLICSAFTPKNEEKKKAEKGVDYESGYLFGFSFSFADSTVYITDIQQMDSLQTGSHGMLLKRGVFSDQLRNNLMQRGSEMPTCAIFFSTKKKKVDKEMTKLMKRYEKSNLSWRILTQEDFQFINSLD